MFLLELREDDDSFKWLCRSECLGPVLAANLGSVMALAWMLRAFSCCLTAYVARFKLSKLSLRSSCTSYLFTSCFNVVIFLRSFLCANLLFYSKLLRASSLSLELCEAYLGALISEGVFWLVANVGTGCCIDYRSIVPNEIDRSNLLFEFYLGGFNFPISFAFVCERVPASLACFILCWKYDLSFGPSIVSEAG